MFAALIYLREYLAPLGDWGYQGVFLMGLAFGLAATLGDLTGYIAGAKEGRVGGCGPFNRRLMAHMDRWGGPSLFTIAVLPAPSAIAGVWAGAVNYPLRRFLLFVAAGKITKLTLIAFTGFYSLPNLLPQIA